MQIKKVFRQERKFLISGEQYYRFSRQFAELFKEDSHNGKDGYMVRSLYFDTLGNKDFEEKLAGVECRRKMRLRIYSPQSRTALLEMKQKQGSNQLKRSLTISREHAEELMKGHYEVLLEYSDPFATECYGVLKTNCYIPKVIVEYKRMAFVFKENDTRITFDSNISASKLTGRFLEEYAGCFPVIHPGCVVMEVKYNNFLLAYIKNILHISNKSETAVSKYALARQAVFRF